MDSMQLIKQWPVDNAAAAVIGSDGTVWGTHGDVERVFPLASVTKLFTAYTTLIAIEEGAVDLDTPAGPPGSTVRHLLAHTSGLAFNEHTTLAQPGRRRLYSNAGFEQLAEALESHSGIDFRSYQEEALFQPLGMAGSSLNGSPGSAASAPVTDLIAFATELQQPRLIAPSTSEQAMTVSFPGVAGVLPGFGRQDPNDWGLGFEIRAHKTPHWTGQNSSPRTCGHFGQSGTFLWVDPEAKMACVVLTDRDFGPWAAEAWPALTDAVLAELRSVTPTAS